MTMSEATFAFVSKLVVNRSAIVLEAGKEYLVESRLNPVAKLHGFSSVDHLVAAMASSSFGTMHRDSVEAMTTNETSFFRDVHPFEALKMSIIPELITSKAATRQLNIWCGAASSGQESYSVAMLLRDSFPELRNWNVTFLSTDLSNPILAKARSGTYSQLEVNRGLPVQLLVKHFTKDGLNWKINSDIRQMIDFRELNLIEKWPVMPPMDVVMMRNVLIYFDIPTKKRILAAIRSVMSPAGYLMLGGAETTMGLDTAFERAQLGKGVAYRQVAHATRRENAAA